MSRSRSARTSPPVEPTGRTNAAKTAKISRTGPATSPTTPPAKGPADTAGHDGDAPTGPVPPARRPTLVGLVACVLVGTAIGWPVLVNGGAATGPSIVAGAAGGLVAWAGFWLFRAMRDLTGVLTAVAAVAITSAALWAAVTFAAPDCPGRFDVVTGAAVGGRCSASEVGTFALIGLLLPVLVAVVTLPALFAARALRALARRLRAWMGT